MKSIFFPCAFFSLNNLFNDSMWKLILSSSSAISCFSATFDSSLAISSLLISIFFWMNLFLMILTLCFINEGADLDNFLWAFFKNKVLARIIFSIFWPSFALDSTRFFIAIFNAFFPKIEISFFEVLTVNRPGISLRSLNLRFKCLKSLLAFNVFFKFLILSWLSSYECSDWKLSWIFTSKDPLRNFFFSWFFMYSSKSFGRLYPLKEISTNLLLTDLISHKTSIFFEVACPVPYPVML